MSLSRKNSGAMKGIVPDGNTLLSSESSTSCLQMLKKCVSAVVVSLPEIGKFDDPLSADENVFAF